MVKSLLQGSGLIKPVQSTSAPDTSGLSLEMYNAQKQQWQEQLSQKRDAIIRKGKADGLDTNQVNKHLDQLYTNARVKALDIKLRFAKLNKPEAPDAMTQRLQAISRVGKDYGRSPEEVAEAIARTKIGSAGASVFFPKPKEPADPMAEFGKLDVIRNKIRSRIKDFQVVPAGEIPSRLRASRDVSKWIGLSPALTVAHRLWPKEKVAPAELQVFDPTLIGYDDKGKEKRGDHRKATPGEMEEFKTLKRGEEWAAAKGREHMSGMLRSAINSPRQVGSVSQQVGAYLDRKQGATGQSQQSGKYTMGQVINQGGKSYKIVGFDTDGEPLVEENR